MHRRRFLTGALTCAFILPAQIAQGNQGVKQPEPPPPLDEDDFQDYPSYLKTAYPSANLHRLLPVNVKIEFKGVVGGRGYDHWHPRQQARLQRATELFAQVWGSEEFKARLANVPRLYWKAAQADISGQELYGHLLGEKKIVIPTFVHRNILTRWIGDENASSSAVGETNLQWAYLNAADPYDLCNTLSHEYTHYNIAGASEDGGHTGPLRGYVSYAIGGITENLAKGEQSSDDDPTYPAKT